MNIRHFAAARGFIAAAQRILTRSLPAAAVLFLATATASADVRYVRAGAANNGNGLSWQTAYNKLFDALDDAAGSSAVTEIWVAAGSYSPRRSGTNRDQTFTLVSDVALLGGFAGTETLADQRSPSANLTILTGDFNGNDGANFSGRSDNARHIAVATDRVNVVVDGFTLRGGNADFPGEALTGGAALHLHRTTATVTRCRFEGNIAGGTAPDLGGFGGALLIQGGEVEVSDCVFAGNRGMNGGAIGIFGSETDRTTIDCVARLIDCDFEGNFSPSQTGGAIWSATADPLVPANGIIGDIRASGCRFIDNDAEYYGAWVDYNSTTLVIDDCVFSGNTSRVAGGALSIGQTVGIALGALVRGCTFEDNGAAGVNGGAIFLQARPCTVDGCIVRGNRGPSAIHSGPVIGFSNGSKELDVRNSLVVENSGTGIFAFRNPSLLVKNCTVARNTSAIAGGQAGGIETSAFGVFIHNTILWNNNRAGVMDQAAQVRSFSVPAQIEYCVLQGLLEETPGAGNIDADPLFANAGAGDYRVAATSLVIDAASNPLAALDTFDADGDGNITERSPFDLAGAARFRDDTAVADTGVGGAGQTGVIDIGAYERAACTGDIDGSGAVGLADLSILLTHFGTAGGAQFGDGDFDGDGDVDLADLSQLLAVFGTSC